MESVPTRYRRLAALILTLWLAGWIPSIIWTWPVGGRHSRLWAQFYAIWIIIGPAAIYLGAVACYGLFAFYRWALPRPPRQPTPPKQTRAQHIAELERELGIGTIRGE